MLVTQSCPTLCDPMDCSPSGSSVHGILQARILEMVAISFSRGSSLTQGSNLGMLHCQMDSLLSIVSVSRSVMPDSLWPHGLQPTRLLCPWDFQSKNSSDSQGITSIEVSKFALIYKEISSNSFLVLLKGRGRNNHI